MPREDPGIAPIARLVVRLFFRRLEVTGLERVPREGGVVFAANHVNGLIDPALLMATLPRPPRFLAKSTLWRNPLVRPFLVLAAAIPVYRRRDGADPAKNAETFTRCHEVLAAGGAIAMFPEGTSHNEPALIELKTGISRIVLEAEERFGGLGTAIVPVGLTFEDKGRFRSRALVRIGEPIDPLAELERYRDTPREAVRSLTARVRAALAELTLNYPSWHEARLIARAAELYARPHGELPASSGLARRFAVEKAFIAGYRTLVARAPERVAAVAEKVRDYDELLELYRLSDAQVASTYPPRGVWRFVTKSLWLLLVRLPLAALGTAINVVPYLAADAVGRGRRRPPDVVATYKIFAAIIFYPAVWLAVALAAGRLWGAGVGVAAFVLGPLSGWVALRFHERRAYFRREARAFLLLRSGRKSMAELVRRRGEVQAAVQALADDYLRAAPDAPFSDPGADRGPRG